MANTATAWNVISIAEHAISTLSVPGYVDFLAADGNAIWATNTDRVEKFEVGTAEPIATVSVPFPCGGMVVAHGSLWVASCKNLSVYRIDLRSNSISAEIVTGLADPGGELSLAFGDGAIWVLSNANGILSRIDPENNTISAKIDVLPNSYCADFSFGSVWITNSGSDATSGSVQRVDPATNSVVATIPTGPAPRFLVAGEGAVWTLNWGDGSITRIDPATNRQVATLALGMEGGGGDIAAGGGKVWVRGTAILLAAIDPDTNRVTTVYGPPAGSGAVRVAGDYVWVTAHDTKTVWVLPSV